MKIENLDDNMSTYPSHLSTCTQKYIERAEVALTAVVREKYHSLNEEMLTHLFWCELSVATKETNQKGEWSRALAEDISSALSHRVAAYELQGDVGGLFCEVQLHNKIKEAKSGGDFGLFTSLPHLENTYSGDQSCTVDFRDRALLVQAKLKLKGGSYRTPKGLQKQTLQENAGYAALVLYEYEDEARTLFAPFKWRPLKGIEFQSIAKMLKQKDAPPLTSMELIDDLFRERLGTADKQIIKEIIETADRPRVKLKFRWRDDKPEGLTVKVGDNVRQQQVQEVRVRG